LDGRLNLAVDVYPISEEMIAEALNVPWEGKIILPNMYGLEEAMYFLGTN